MITGGQEAVDTGTGQVNAVERAAKHLATLLVQSIQHGHHLVTQVFHGLGRIHRNTDRTLVEVEVFDQLGDGEQQHLPPLEGSTHDLLVVHGK